jgi:hypothetical protein
MRSLRLSVLPILLLCLFLGLVGALSASAAKPKPKAPPDPRILVTAVNLAAKQISVKLRRTGQVTIYTVDDLTHVTFQNNPGSISDIKIGQQVFEYVERDGHTLDSLTVGPADPAPTAPKS